MKQKEQKNGMNPSQEQFPAVEMRVNRLGTGDGHCLAHLSVTLGGVFAVRGLRLMEGKNGPFLNFPSYKSGNGYQDICFPVSAQLTIRYWTGTRLRLPHRVRRNWKNRSLPPVLVCRCNGWRRTI